MGLNIADIVPRKAVSFPELKGKTIVIDAYNVIYQFLSSIRQPDGTPLMDSSRKITSHLSGLFYRNLALMQEGLKLVYVFDGIPPDLKYGTNKKRTEIKAQASEKYEQAKQEENIEEMNKYAKQSVRLTKEMVQESIELLEALGIPCIQAPSEAEAQASYLCKINKEIYAVGSQDYDSLLFQTPRLIQNLTLARKRKTPTGFIYISPEIIELESVLNTQGISHEQLICLGILVGTDYNQGGIKGIGQKKALEIVRKFKTPIEIFKSVENLLEKQKNKFNWQEIFSLFKKPDVKNFEIKSLKLNLARVKEILLEREFSEDRIDSALAKLNQVKKSQEQKKLF
ncbi:MAG: flap endonuclease-1 [Candidatus Pacearchaeota archaeon]|nr:flap endonuclease-1 [Candidatus Pacearchaeota archaeon]